MSDELARSYDEAPYVSRAFWYTHPDTLATVATLNGMNPAPPHACRVLELGCAAGGNLLPMAEALPESSFVGIDFSPVQIKHGKRLIDTLGLKNLRLEAISITDVPEDFGTFDYIIAHGVYSWVPPIVQEKTLELCARHLGPHGVAYISYNTYPGWHLRQMAREMMLYHVADVEPSQRAGQAAALVQFLQQNAPADATAYRAALTDEIKRLETGGEDYILHEFLDTHNEPLYFHQFVARAAAKHLQYLGEARQLPAPLSPTAQQTLAPLAGDRVKLEQYLDFVRVRMFRWSLLVHEKVKLGSVRPAEAVARLRIAAATRAEATDEQLNSADQRVELRTPQGHAIAATDPPIKKALTTLGRVWPRMLTLDQLSPSGEMRDELAELVLRGFLNGIIELHVDEFAFETRVSERPEVSPYTRLAAANGLPIANRRHEVLAVNDFQRLVLTFLNGIRDRDEILTALQNEVAAGRIQIGSPGGGKPTSDQISQFIATELDRALADFSRGAILTG